MRILLITKDRTLIKEANAAYKLTDNLETYSDWQKALDKASGADLMILDLLATLVEPHKIEGYEKFAYAKMSHPEASKVPLVLITPPDDYDLDAMVGWPDFVHGVVRRPVGMKIFRRVSTWV